ncbi:hypothetical protein D3C72_1955350 [compost metagenome]
MQTPLTPDSSSPYVVAPDQLVQQSGSMVLSPNSPASNGSARVKVSASQWISSLKLNMVVDDISAGGITRVCVDDAPPPPPPPPPAATPVPVGAGAAGAATIAIVGFAAFLARRRNGSKQS